MEAVSFVTLGVKNLSIAMAFYERLGHRVECRLGGALGYMAFGAITVVLCPWTVLDAELGLDPGTQPAERGPSWLSCNVFPGPEAVDRAVALAQAAGAQMLVGPLDRPWGGRSAVFADPDGHRWELVWNPAYSASRS